MAWNKSSLYTMTEMGKKTEDDLYGANMQSKKWLESG